MEKLPAQTANTTPAAKKKKVTAETVEEMEQRLRKEILADIESGKIQVKASSTVPVPFLGLTHIFANILAGLHAQQ